MSTAIQETIETLFENQTTAIGRDLKINLTKFLEGGALSREEAHMTLLAAASNVEHRRLAAYAIAQLQAAGIGPDEIREIEEGTALVGMLNTYYRFRHFMGSPEEYRVAGLRMTALARPLIGKERFEMISFAVSILNGCEACTRAHEKALKDAGVSSEKIHDLVRLASVVKALKTLIKEA